MGLFPCHSKYENENGSSNSVFPCRTKTVGTKVHAFQRIWTTKVLSSEKQGLTFQCGSLKFYSTTVKLLRRMALANEARVLLNTVLKHMHY